MELNHPVHPTMLRALATFMPAATFLFTHAMTPRTCNMRSVFDCATRTTSVA